MPTRFGSAAGAAGARLGGDAANTGLFWKPRMAAQLTVPVAGSITERIAMADSKSVVELPVRVTHASYTRNDHNTADSATISAEWSDVGIDPRFFSSARVRLWIGTAKNGDTWEPNDDDLRFCGVVTRIGRAASEENGFSVDLDFDDYTALFLESKHFPPDGAPRYSQTISQAWQQLCDHTGPLDEDGNVISTVSALRDRLVFRGDAEDVAIGKYLPTRLQKFPITFKHDDTAWGVWQAIIQNLGLITFIDLDECVVTTATDYYTSKNAPLLVFGQNIASLEESREIHFSGKGERVLSFDALTGTTLEAFWPPIGSRDVTRKKVGAGRVRASTSTSTHVKSRPPPTQDQIEQSEARNTSTVPGVSDQAGLEARARRIYEERSRQELQGVVQTSEMLVRRHDGTSYDLLDLHGGEVICIVFDPEHLREIAALTDINARIARSLELGYSEQVAELVARNLVEFAKLDPTFFVKSVDVECDSADDASGGTFNVSITFANRVQYDMSGNTDSKTVVEGALAFLKDPDKMRAYIEGLNADQALALPALLDNPQFLKDLAATLRKP